MVPFYVKSADVREFKFDHYRDGTKRFDKFRFDEEAKRLGPGQVLIARAVSDSGGHGHNRPTGVSTHGDQYAIGKGTSMKNALFNSGSFKGVSTTDSMTGDGEGAGHAFRGNQHVKGHGNGGVHTPDTKSAAFKSWFEGSKVVDDAGKPLVVYHGTEVAGITNFHIPKDGVAYFTPDVGYGYIQKTANVMPCYLSLKNPLYTQNSSWIEGVRSDPSWVADLKAKGHDGIIYAKQGGSLTGKGPSGWGDDRVQICVFEPHQIKSAIANTGRFGKHGVIYDGVEKDGVGEVGPAAATITLDGSMTKE